MFTFRPGNSLYLYSTARAVNSAGSIHEKLDVYQCATEFLSIVTEILHKMPRGYGYISDQLHRASLSISYNIAEAAGKNSPKDKANRFNIARDSTLECGAIIDSLAILKITDPQKHTEAKLLLVRIAQMLSKLAPK